LGRIGAGHEETTVGERGCKLGVVTINGDMGALTAHRLAGPEVTLSKKMSI
jgi:hypothetical protein